MAPTRSVGLESGRLLIDGQPRVVLSASVFPFRIRREHWRDRLAAVQRLGYTAVDVYFPWNHHETVDGGWDFTGERDVAHFLELCAEAGLLVIARPGPYICSEWDGGGLPARLALIDGLRVRQNEPRFLAEVERWFAQILPILASHQRSTGGPVILVQLENELDFFDCDDPAGYQGALRDLARQHRLDVPLIACAGQGDLLRASGAVADIIPCPNLYPDDDSTDIEAHTRYFESALASDGLPLLVPETNRLHRTLKRMVVAGARMLGPYLQTSGWNPALTTSVNNWGDLLAFMTHDYDFGGALGPDGAERPDAADARRLTSTIAALGTRLAAGSPMGTATGVTHSLRVAPYGLALDGGGELLALTQLDETPTTATVSAGQDRAVAVEIDIPHGSCVLIVRDMPLPTIQATLVVTGGELTELVEQGCRVDATITVATDAATTVVACAATPVHVAGDLSVTVDDGLLRVTGTGTTEIVTTHGRMSIEHRPREIVSPAAPEPVDVVGIGATSPSSDATPWHPVQEGGTARTLEQLAVTAGIGRYRARTPLPEGTTMIVANGAADIVHPHAAAGHAWRASSGVPIALPVTSTDEPVDLVTRIWGHSNFDDPRLPSLRLGSPRGMTNALAVARTVPLGEGWTVVGTGDVSVGGQPAPRGWFGGWMTGITPQQVSYRRVIAEHEAGTAVLRMIDSAARVDVAVDGEHRGVVSPHARMMWLGELHAGATIELTVTRTWGEPPGMPELLVGTEIVDWDIFAAGIPEIISGRDAAEILPATLPLAIPTATARWVRIYLGPGAERRDAHLRLGGAGFHATAVVGTEVIGRIWSSAPDGAALRGGSGEYVLIPASLRHHPVDILLEATDAVDGALVTVSCD